MIRRIKGTLLCMCKLTLLILSLTSNVLKAEISIGREKIIEALIHRGDYDRALDHLINLEFSAKLPQQRLAAALISSQIYQKSGKYRNAIRLLSGFKERETEHLDSSQNDQVNLEIARCFLLNHDLAAAKYHLGLVSTKSKDLDLNIKHDSLDNPIFESPYFSAAMSALIPGSGQIIAGRPLDAATNIFMIAIPSFIGLEASKNNEAVFASVSYFIAAFFYLGNISSAYKLQKTKLENSRKKAWLSNVRSIIAPQVVGAGKTLGISVGIEAHILNE